MTIPRALLCGLALIAAAIFLNGHVSFAQTGAVEYEDQKGPYAITAGEATFVWRMNVTSGQVSYCLRGNTTNTQPTCSPWSRVGRIGRE